VTPLNTKATSLVFIVLSTSEVTSCDLNGGGVGREKSTGITAFL
jgi:hypothetical protein